MKPKKPEPPKPPALARRDALLYVMGALVAVPALMPLFAGFLPRLYFESDPRAGFDPAMLTMFGPAGALVWHTISIGCAAVALTLYGALGGRWNRWVLLLCASGIAIALWHALSNSENLVLMAACVTGVVLAGAASHIGCFLPARRCMVALVVASLVPVGLQASYDVLIQKPRDIAWWHQNEAKILEQRGSEAGSSDHLLLERRAMSNDATGPFGFSNALGTLAAGAAALALCVGVGGLAGRRAADRRASLAALGAGGCGLAAVWFTHSTGAAGAMVIALALAGLAWCLRRGRAGCVVPWLALAAVALPIVVVLVRGGMGPPETMAGERSLLFRFHYWQASVGIVRDGLPMSAVLGVGPFDFGQGYLLHKNPLSPENVSSAHNALVDWFTMLGLGGAAWSVLALGWLFMAARRSVDVSSDSEPTSPHETTSGTPTLLQRPHVLAALLCAGVLFGTQYVLQSAMMDVELVLVWLAGLAGFVVVAAMLLGRVGFPGQAVRLGLFALAAAVLVHSQIDMAFALMATAAPAWFLLGLAGSGRPTESAPGFRVNRSVWAVLVLGGAAVVFHSVFLMTPVVRHQAHLAEASRWFAADQPGLALVSLEKAQSVMPADTTAPRWIAAARRDEMLILAQRGDLDAARKAYTLAIQAIDYPPSSDTPTIAMDRLRVGLLNDAAQALNEPQLIRQAVTLLQSLAERAPYSLEDAVLLGDLLWKQGEYADAKEAYRRALRIDRDLYLDNAMQLNASERARLETRVEMDDTGPDALDVDP
ncbi:MAG: tetratricopeptide repeat protein [Phycisphaerales bacterium JB063]